MKLFYEFQPQKFNNKTNGVTHRRWLLKANPELSSLITKAIGPCWIKDPQELIHLKRYASDPAFQQELESVKQKRKAKLAKRIYEKTGIAVDESSIFDVQVKRLHEYKRQLLNSIYFVRFFQ